MLFGDSRSIGGDKRKVAKKHFGYFSPSGGWVDPSMYVLTDRFLKSV